MASGHIYEFPILDYPMSNLKPIILRYYLKDGEVQLDITQLITKIIDEDFISQHRTQLMLGVTPAPIPMEVQVSLKYELLTDMEQLFRD